MDLVLILSNQNLIRAEIEIKRIKTLFDKEQKHMLYLDMGARYFSLIIKVLNFLSFGPRCLRYSHFSSKYHFLHFF